VLRDINGLGNFAGYLMAALFVEAQLSSAQRTTAPTSQLRIKDNNIGLEIICAQLIKYPFLAGCGSELVGTRECNFHKCSEYQIKFIARWDKIIECSATLVGVDLTSMTKYIARFSLKDHATVMQQFSMWQLLS
jgi:hypothetical protein